MYGTTTLIDRRLGTENIFRVPFESKFGRDALFMDLALQNGKVLRICNVHLESLTSNPPMRPGQMGRVAGYLHDETSGVRKGVHAGIVVGDMNAIEPFDRSLHTENRLRDAYLELGGKEDMEEGYTWGQNSSVETQEKYGGCRMDKVLYCGGVEVVLMERIGEGVIVEDEAVREEMQKKGLTGFVSDHLGLMVEMRLMGTSLSILDTQRDDCGSADDTGGMIYIASSDQPGPRRTQKPTEEDSETTKEQEASDKEKMDDSDSSDSSSWNWGSSDLGSCNGGSSD
jgi:hypothetical protein